MRKTHWGTKFCKQKKLFHNAKTLQKMPQEKNIITYEKMMSWGGRRAFLSN